MYFIRDIEKKLEKSKKVHIVCELLDERNEDLVNIYSGKHKNDFVVSAKLSALFLTQVSQEPHLLPIFKELFDEKGSEIYLKNIEDYININENKQITYGEIILAGSKLNRQTVIGYQKKDMLPNLNLKKDTILTPEKGDKIIVVEYTDFS
jgi:hypothetical protein